MTPAEGSVHMQGWFVRPRAPRTIVGLLGVIMSLALLAGCGPVGPGEAARARQAVNGPTGTMTLQLPERPTAFDPLAVPGSADQALAAAHFEPLIAAVEGRVMPRMAVWWGMADEGRRLMLNVKRDRWSDDQRMSATDVLFTLETHLRPGSRSPLLPVLLQIEGAPEFHEGRVPHVAGIVAETARTVTVTLTESDTAFLSKLTGVLVLPKHIYAGRDLTDPQAFREPRVGSGAYLFDAWQSADQVTLLPNPQAKPFTRLSGVTARTVPPQAVIQALEERTLDVAPALAARDLNRVPASHRALVAPGDRVIGLSGTRGPLADARVRRALAYAIDRERLLVDHFGGHGRVVDSVLFAPDWAVSPQRAHYPHDPGRARSLLAEAGWGEGTELSLVALTPDEDRAVWDAVIDDLAEVGLRATIIVRPTTDRGPVWADPAVDGVIDTHLLPVPEPSPIEPWVICGTESGFCSPRLDSLLQRGSAALETTERQEIYREADQLLSVELPVIPLWVPDASIVIVQGRAGVNPRLHPPTAMIDLWGPA